MACLIGLWQLLGDALGDLAQLTQRPVGLQPGQRTRQRTHRVLCLPIVLRWERHLHIIVAFLTQLIGQTVARHLRRAAATS